MTWLLAVSLVINWLCTNIAAEEVYIKSIMETAKFEGFDVNVVVIYETDVVV